ncbi:MAG TPA: hypothetical protein H9743_00530 [Candidatus Mediterraneibacter vanvlietii]|nr:hypothetical protein [Candidatus Mediterraneibacter vanvlietii]
MTRFYVPDVFEDTISLGSPHADIKVRFSPEKIGEDYFRIIHGLAEEEKNKYGENAEKYSQLFIELLVLLFGQDNAMHLLDAYSDNYEKLIDDVVFYTGTKIAPVMKAASQARKKKIKAEKKAMRALSHRRWFHK